MQVPDGWTKGIFEEGIELISGQHVKANLVNELQTGKPYFTGPADFTDGKIRVTKYTNHSTKFCQKGDLLITVKGSGTGKVIESDNEYGISRQLMAVRALNFDPKFTYYNLVGSVARYEGAAAGLIPGITRNDVLHTPLLIPPLPEQQKIAQILSTWDKAIEKLEALIAAKQKRKKALMQHLITGKNRFSGFDGEWKEIRLKKLIKEEKARNKDSLVSRVLSVTNHSGFVLPEEQFSRQVASSDLSNYKIVRKGQFGYNPSRINVGSFARLDSHSWTKPLTRRKEPSLD